MNLIEIETEKGLIKLFYPEIMFVTKAGCIEFSVKTVR